MYIYIYTYLSLSLSDGSLKRGHVELIKAGRPRLPTAPLENEPTSGASAKRQHSSKWVLKTSMPSLRPIAVMQSAWELVGSAVREVGRKGRGKGQQVQKKTHQHSEVPLVRDDTGFDSFHHAKMLGSVWRIWKLNAKFDKVFSEFAGRQMPRI